MLYRSLAAAAVLSLATACAAATPKPGQLAETVWTVKTIDGQRARSPRAEIRFLPDRISATVGCNGLGGPWKISKGQLEGGPFMSTMMYCEGLMEQERTMADVLGGKARIDLTRQTLTLRSGKHVIVAVRRR
ncbi:MAG: META domain-containing protein [Novosphingobium sp.]|jgi:heat shock protein HslJ